MAFTQSRMESPEELATLFSRQMTFQQPAPQQAQPSPPPQQQQSEPEPIIYSISQHYHHSAHVVQQQDHPMHQRPSSVPPKPTQPSVEQVLLVHGVNPTALSPQQLELFKTADAPQQQRLLELWTIYPPTNNAQQTDASVTWSSTTVEQEEFLAQLRHEQMVAERDAQMSLDGTPLTPVQSTDGHWVSAAYVEPYMMSGYEMLARREYEESGKEEEEVNFGSYRLATDPVYAGDWNGRNKIEHQYGEFQQMSAMEF